MNRDYNFWHVDYYVFVGRLKPICYITYSGQHFNGLQKLLPFWNAIISLTTYDAIGIIYLQILHTIEISVPSFDIFAWIACHNSANLWTFIEEKILHGIYFLFDKQKNYRKHAVHFLRDSISFLYGMFHTYNYTIKISI